MDTKINEALLAARGALAALSARCDEAVRPDDTDRDGVTVKTGLLRQAREAHRALSSIPVSDPTIMSVPAVKPLVWNETHGGSFLRADSLSGVYEVPATDPDRDDKVLLAEATHRERVLCELLLSVPASRLAGQ